jgi:signal transduction histidine kinase
VTGEIARRRARYTSLTLALLVPIGLVALALTAAIGGEGYAEEALILAAVAAFAALYPSSRGRFTALAAHATLLITAGAVWGAWLLARDAPQGTEALFFLAVPITMASLLLPSGAAAWYGGLNVLAVLAAPATMSSQPTPNVIPSLALLLVVIGVLSVNSARVRERDLARLETIAARLAEHDAQRLRMLNTIAHDLASPLTPLKLQLRLVPKDKPLSPERLALIERNLGQVERLVTDVKDLARLDAGELKIDLKPADLGEIASGAGETFQEDAGGRGLSFQARVEGPLPILGDAQRLTQVLYNLVTNALKFTPPGGQVTLDARRVDGEARVSVRDTGRGLTPGEVARLFKPFSQVHELGEVKERGTGLGLYISQGIAKAHGGRLTVESEGRGKGSTFTLAVPLR